MMDKQQTGRLFSGTLGSGAGLSVFILIALAGQTPSHSAGPLGAVLYKTIPPPPVHFFYDKVTSSDVLYYGDGKRGPLWENKYAAYRFQVVAAQCGTADSFNKKKYDPVLYVYDDPKFAKDIDHPYGSDVMHGGSSVGTGGFSFSLDHAKTFISAPYYQATDSIVVTILDSSQATPHVRVGYYGWNIGPGGKLTAIVDITTTWESRISNFSMKLSGNPGVTVITGLAASAKPNVTVFRDTAAGLIASLGKQSTIGDSILVAVYTGPKYFDGYVEIPSSPESSHAMILKADADRTMKWAVITSWVQEPDPLFRHPDWLKTAFSGYVTGLTPARRHAPNSPRFKISKGMGVFGLNKNAGGFNVQGKKLYSSVHPLVQSKH